LEGLELSALVIIRIACRNLNTLPFRIDLCPLRIVRFQPSENTRARGIEPQSATVFVSLKLKELERKVERRFGKTESASAGGAFSPGGFAKQHAACFARGNSPADRHLATFYRHVSTDIRLHRIFLAARPINIDNAPTTCRRTPTLLTRL